MATVTIPTKTDGTQRYSQNATLGGNVYGLEFIWNGRDQSWSFVMTDSSGDQLLVRKVVLGSPLFSRSQDARLPFGEMIAVDTSGQNIDAGLTDLGTRVILTFTDGTDILALG